MFHRSPRCRRGAPDASVVALVVALAAVLAALVAVVIPAPPASAQALTDVRGRVTGAAGGALQASVEATRLDVPSLPVKAGTDPDGSYRLALAPGRYQIRFAAGGHLDEWWSDAASVTAATPVVVGSAAVADLDAVLTPLAAMSGRVTDHAGLPVVGARVRVSAGSATDLAHCCSADAIGLAGATTGRDGRWLITGLEHDSYVVRFLAPGHAAQYWPAVDDPGDAQRIEVAAGAVTADVDARLDLGGAIAGTVTDASGAAVPGVMVFLRGDDTLADASATLDEHGRYAVDGLTPGRYRIRYGASDTVHVSEWYGDTQERSEATVVDVGGGTRATADLTVGEGGSVRARYLPADGSAPGWFTVSLYQRSADGWTSVRGSFGEDGRAVARVVPPGTYRVLFGATERGRASGWWRGGSSVESAAEIVVDDEHRDIDLGTVTAPPAARISGTVSRPDGAPGYPVVVDAWRRDIGIVGTTGGWFLERSVATDASGAYAFGDLRGGTYRLKFHSSYYFLDGWWGGREELASGEDVVVASGESVGGLAHRLSAGATIAGTIRRADGSPGGSAVAYRRAPDGTWTRVRSAVAGSDGRYTIPLLQAGTYRVAFEVAGTSQWWRAAGDTPVSAPAGSDVVVAHEATVARIDATLVASAVLSGRVSVDHPSQSCPCSLRTLRLLHGAWQPGPVARTDAEGRFRLEDVAPGHYTYAVQAPGAVEQFLGDTPIEAEAQVVTIGVGEVRLGADVRVPHPGSLSGTIGGPYGPERRADVTAFLARPDGSWTEAAVAYAADDGTYRFETLVPGTYRLRYRGRQGTSWGYRLHGPGTAEPVVVAPGREARAVALPELESAQVRGVVTESDGSPAQGVHVLFHSREGRVVGGGATFGDGSYQASVPPGAYRVSIGGNDGVHGTRWPDGTDSTGSWLAVPEGSLVEGIDGSVERLGSISGTVTYADGTPSTATVQIHRITEAGWQEPIAAKVAEDGTYLADDLEPGSYRVQLGPGRWWPSGADGSTAEDVVVRGGRAVDGIDGDVDPTADARSPRVVARDVPVITGTTDVGRTLQASAPGWSTSPVVNAYRWFADGVEVPGATGSTYVVRTSDLGRRIAVEVRGRRAGWTPGSSRSASTSPIGSSTTPYVAAVDVPTVSGIPVVGQTLTADPGRWVPTGAVFSYQWLRDGVAVPGATTTSYRLGQADAGRTVVVRVSGARGPLAPAAVESDPGPYVRGGLLTVTAGPLLTGEPVLGQALTVRRGVWSPEPGRLEVTWLRDGVVLPDQHGIHYRPTTGDLGHRISASVTAARPGYVTTVRTTPESAPVVRGTVVGTSAPRIRGRALVGGRLSVTSGTWTPTPGRLLYQWTRDGRRISGATSSTYRPRAVDRGHRLRVVVAAYRPEWALGVATTAPTGVVRRR